MRRIAQEGTVTKAPFFSRALEILIDNFTEAKRLYRPILKILLSLFLPARLYGYTFSKIGVYAYFSCLV